jgi:lipopolysaccharide export system protein LptA
VRATALALVSLTAVMAGATAEGQPRSPGTTPPATTAPAASPAPASPGPKPRNAQPVTVDAEKMERFGKESLTIFTGNVIARQSNNVQYADRMEVYFDEKENRILRTVSTGNVRIITNDCRTGTARRAEYYDLEQRIVLIGNARVWQQDNVVSGETITIYISQDRAVAQAGKGERVKGVFYSRGEDESRTAAAKPSGPACVN